MIQSNINNKDIIKDISEKDQLTMPQEKLELKTVNAQFLSSLRHRREKRTKMFF